MDLDWNPLKFETSYFFDLPQTNVSVTVTIQSAFFTEIKIVWNEEIDILLDYGMGKQQNETRCVAWYLTVIVFLYK